MLQLATWRPLISHTASEKLTFKFSMYIFEYHPLPPTSTLCSLTWWMLPGLSRFSPVFRSRVLLWMQMAVKNGWGLGTRLQNNSIDSLEVVQACNYVTYIASWNLVKILCISLRAICECWFLILITWWLTDQHRKLLYWRSLKLIKAVSSWLHRLTYLPTIWKETVPDQWPWVLVWERDYMCWCIQMLTSYAMDSSHTEYCESLLLTRA